MNPDLLRWMAADREGREDEADAAFKAVFRAAPAPEARPAFIDRVMEALARDVARRRRRARIAAASGVAASILMGLGVTVALIAQGPKLIVWAVDACVAAAVWMSAAFENGLDLWAILAQIGSAAAAVIATPQVSSVLIAIEAIGAVALYGLHRIFASEQESS
ncbi:MAG: hypothetical protein ACRD09_10370 [Vicinamibacterales bacterium]